MIYYGITIDEYFIISLINMFIAVNFCRIKFFK